MNRKVLCNGAIGGTSQEPDTRTDALRCGMRLHFELGRRDHIDRIEVHWTGGAVDVLEDVRMNQLFTVVEGASPVR
jgi:hypothetical protein